MSHGPNVVCHPRTLTRQQREIRHGHPGALVWLTGLPGSGKSTIAHAVDEYLHCLGLQTVVLDGDNLRHGLCADLGFSPADRNENVRRTGEVAKLFLDQGMVVLAALVSPMREARERVRQSIPAGDFIEVHCSCTLSVCRERDPKGLYAKAASGIITDFTGISAPYEMPLDPELTFDTNIENIERCVQRLSQFLLEKFG